jgi:hypothetical protein
MRWIVYWLTLLSADEQQVPVVDAQAAGAVCVAYSSLQKEIVDEDEELEELIHPPIIIEGPSIDSPQPDCPDGNCPVPQVKTTYRRRR